MLIGAPTDGALVEIGVLDIEGDDPVVIHAMPLRRKFHRFLTSGVMRMRPTVGDVEAGDGLGCYPGAGGSGRSVSDLSPPRPAKIVDAHAQQCLRRSRDVRAGFFAGEPPTCHQSAAAQVSGVPQAVRGSATAIDAQR